MCLEWLNCKKYVPYFANYEVSNAKFKEDDQVSTCFRKLKVGKWTIVASKSSGRTMIYEIKIMHKRVVLYLATRFSILFASKGTWCLV